MAIDKQTIEKIKDAANIVDVVSEFVTLRKSGSNYKGLCPFHNEKTPSFIVSPARGIALVADVEEIRLALSWSTNK